MLTCAPAAVNDDQVNPDTRAAPGRPREVRETVWKQLLLPFEVLDVSFTAPGGYGPPGQGGGPSS